MEAPAVGQFPDTTYRRLAVVHRSTHSVQLSAVELPDEDADDDAAERDLLRRNINMLALPARTARIMGRHCSRSRHHVGVEEAGVEGFLHGGPIRLTGQAQHATHG